jgi:ATP-dependent DNA helicase PIF1
LNLGYKKTSPLGGLQVIFTGDFYQLSPVSNIFLEKEDSMFCFEHELWNQLFPKENQIVLKTIFRQKDETLLKILKYIRKGQITPSSRSALESRIFNTQELNLIKKDKVLTILSPIKRDVEHINLKEYLKLDKSLEECVYDLDYIDLYIKYDENKDDNEGEHEKKNLFALLLKSNEQLKKDYDFLASNILAEKCLKLKIGTHVMCVANINLGGELQIANGSQGIIVGFNDKKLPYVKFNTIKEPILIDYYIWKSEFNKRVGLMQLPLIYSWAITIHKSQGLTLENAIIDIGSNIFADGQTYVALSRVKSLGGLYLTSFDCSKIKCNPLVKKFYGDS